MAHEPYVGNDIYCDWILSGKLPVDVVAETEEVLAFHHSRPFWPVHLVVIPKAHTPSLVDLGDSGEYQDSKHLHFHVCSGDPLREE